MHDIPARIADLLLEIEGTLRSHGMWEKEPPVCSALASNQPFCMDTLGFEQWIQWVFLPRMKSILEDNHPLPAKSGILTYAEAYLHKNHPPTSRLLNSIRHFDELITLNSRIRWH